MEGANTEYEYRIRENSFENEIGKRDAFNPTIVISSRPLIEIDQCSSIGSSLSRSRKEERFFAFRVITFHNGFLPKVKRQTKDTGTQALIREVLSDKLSIEKIRYRSRSQFTLRVRESKCVYTYAYINKVGPRKAIPATVQKNAFDHLNLNALFLFNVLTEHTLKRESSSVKARFRACVPHKLSLVFFSSTSTDPLVKIKYEKNKSPKTCFRSRSSFRLQVAFVREFPSLLIIGLDDLLIDLTE